jgi:murein L,D-transpeptidase YcbB/YkuD
LAILAGTLLAGPAAAAIDKVELPASREQGLDMILIDEGAMPQEPEQAKHLGEVEDVSWSGSAIDLLIPVHHLYTDLRRQLSRYHDRWAKLPQVQVPTDGPMIRAGSSDPRLPVLRERLGLARQGGFDKALQARLSEYQQAHGLNVDGKPGPETLASLNLGATHYEQVILLNMERARRLPTTDAKGKYVLVDAGSARLWMYENGRPVDSMKVIVGTPHSETPMLAALMRYSNVNPYWNVPPDLVKNLIAPKVLSEGGTYLKDRGYQVLGGWGEDAAVMDAATIDWQAVASGDLEVRVRQLPGGANSMGEIKFMMPNEYGIYLHDTPRKALFAEDDRWISNGCIRVEDAHRLARWLYGEMPKAATPDREERVDLPHPVPVYVTYLTVGAEGKTLTFRKDRYDRDAAVLARFKAKDRPMVDAQGRLDRPLAAGS